MAIADRFSKYITIPVYPDAVSLSPTVKCCLSIEAPLCEDDMGFVSFISDKAKTDWLNNQTIVQGRRR